jgi:hypothetical protein
MAHANKKPDVRTDQRIGLPVKTAVTISADANQRLRAAAMVEGKTQSELVETLVLRHLGSYFVGKRGDGINGDDDQADTAGQGGAVQ